MNIDVIVPVIGRVQMKAMLPIHVEEVARNRYRLADKGSRLTPTIGGVQVKDTSQKALFSTIAAHINATVKPVKWDA